MPCAAALPASDDVDRGKEVWDVHRSEDIPVRPILLNSQARTPTCLDMCSTFSRAQHLQVP